MQEIPREEKSPEEEEPKPETPKVEHRSDIPSVETESGLEPRPEGSEEREREITELREVIKGLGPAEEPKETEPKQGEGREEKIREYRERHLPEHLRERGVVSRVLTDFWTRWIKFEREGEENIPEKGPFIVIGNHFGGGDAEAILRTFKEFDPHFAIAKNMWWDSNPITRWFLKKLRMIPVEESLSNISEEEKEAALKRQGGWGKKVFRKIIDREKEGRAPTNIEFIRQAVAALSRGDVVVVFPEGLWLHPEGIGGLAREKAEMKQGYRGIEVIAKQYKALTGKDLPIVPTAFVEDRVTGKKRLIIGKQLSLEDNDTELSDIDWAMAHVASMLPKEQRGHYAEASEKIKAE